MHKVSALSAIIVPLCALAWIFAAENQYLPRVTKSLIDSPEEADYSEVDLVRFSDSETFIFIHDGVFHISFNGGESWETIDEFKGGARYVMIDPFHKGRAFAAPCLVTEDQGRSWKQFDIESSGCHLVTQTHPTDKRLLFGQAPISSSREVIYASNDCGQSFELIDPPFLNNKTTPAYERFNCHFVLPSKESALDRDGIYCIHTTYTEKQKDTFQYDWKSILFFTPDLGKTTKVFNELNDLLVKEIFIFSSGIFVLTSENGFKNSKLWLSNGGSFEPVKLPKEVISLKYAWYFFENDQEELLLTVEINDHEDHTVHKHLILNPSSLGFSWDHLPHSDGLNRYFRLNNLKGTLWKKIDETPENFKEIDIQLKRFATKASFDKGKTWKNLRVIDSSGTHKHLFKCDIDDVKHCCFQPSNLYNENDEPTAGIIIEIGTVGRFSTNFDRNDMTFISRDGGASWELVFEFPVYTALLDFGNIIIALPHEGDVYTKFLFSLDQGRTWDEYCFDEPIHAYHYLSIDTSGLKALITIQREKKGFAEYVFYSLDFSQIFKGTVCTEDDFETWYLYDGKCIDGVRYSFDRRKPDAKCLVRKTFKKLELHEERCES